MHNLRIPVTIMCIKARLYYFMPYSVEFMRIVNSLSHIESDDDIFRIFAEIGFDNIDLLYVTF